MQGRGGVAVLARLAAGLLAQYPLKLRRTDALLVLGARPPVLAQEHLLVADVRCKERRRGEGERWEENEGGIKRAQQSDRVTGRERIVGE